MPVLSLRILILKTVDGTVDINDVFAAIVEILGA